MYERFCFLEPTSRYPLWNPSFGLACIAFLASFASLSESGASGQLQLSLSAFPREGGRRDEERRGGEASGRRRRQVTTISDKDFKTSRRNMSDAAPTHGPACPIKVWPHESLYYALLDCKYTMYYTPFRFCAVKGGPFSLRASGRVLLSASQLGSRPLPSDSGELSQKKALLPSLFRIRTHTSSSLSFHPSLSSGAISGHINAPGLEKWKFISRVSSEVSPSPSCLSFLFSSFFRVAAKIYTFHSRDKLDPLLACRWIQRANFRIKPYGLR